MIFDLKIQAQKNSDISLVSSGDQNIKFHMVEIDFNHTDPVAIEPVSIPNFDNGKPWFIYNAATGKKVHLELNSEDPNLTEGKWIGDNVRFKLTKVSPLAPNAYYIDRFGAGRRLRYDARGNATNTTVAKPKTGTWTKWVITPSGDGTSYFIDCFGAPSTKRRMRVSDDATDLLQGGVSEMGKRSRFRLIQAQ